MTKTKSIFFILVVIALVLAACGGGTTNQNTGDNNDANAEHNNNEHNDNEATEEPMDDMGLPDLGGREVTVAIENAYLPFNYVDTDTGEAGGWDYEAWDEICARLNCVPVYTEAGWDGLIQAVADGQFDAAADGITITEDRAEIVDFSMGYINVDQRLLVRIDEDRFETIEEFAADETLRMGTQTGTTNYETATKFLSEERIDAFTEFGVAVQALIAGDVDAVIIDETAGTGYKGENADELTLVGPSISGDQLGFIFPKGSDLVDPVDQALQSMLEDGFLNEINVKFFGESFNLSYDDIGSGAYGIDAYEIPDLGGREVTIAIENAYLPFNYVDLEGNPGGWDYEAWDEICEILNCVPVYTEAAWDGMIQAVADGQFDAAADGITITEDRAEIVDFSMGYINVDQRLLVRIDEDRFETIEEFAADEILRMGTQVGTTNYETAVKFLPEDRIDAFAEYGVAVQALVSGDVDAVIIDETAGAGYKGENADSLTLVGPSISGDKLGFIYPMGSDLVAPVDIALQVMMDNGFLNEINLKYFGPGFVMTYDDIQ